MKVVKLVVTVLVVLFVISTAFAQTTTPTDCRSKCQVKVGEKFAIAFDHDPTAVEGVRGPTVGYRIYMDGKKLGDDLPLTALVDGTVKVADVALTVRGNHNLAVAAYNLDGENRTPNLVIIVGELPPGLPGNLRIQITATIARLEDGTMQLIITGARAEATE